MKTVESEAVRIGGQLARGVVSALEAFLNVMAKPELRGKDMKDVKKEVSENFAYVNADEFFTAQVAKGYTEFDSIGIEEAQMVKFDQLAIQYGMKYHFESKPDNIADLLKKSNPTEDELAILDTWTRDVDGVRKEITDDFKITFAMKDMPKLECIVKDLRAYVDRNLDERLRQAAEKQNAIPNKERVKERHYDGVSK